MAEVRAGPTAASGCVAFFAPLLSFPYISTRNLASRTGLSTRTGWRQRALPATAMTCAAPPRFPLTEALHDPFPPTEPCVRAPPSAARGSGGAEGDEVHEGSEQVPGARDGEAEPSGARAAL